ncbi:MAG TPA: 30S ribosomal protein S9 [Chloroflexota bacterium]|nr:30S ribosomal protein S9 [Chloroflexota bacterium]HEX2987241.1 30S ribosomal protein S9 [Chloroflexota bacterium]
MDQIAAVGRRKTAVARVVLVPGSGAVMINGMELKDRFARAAWQDMITLPMKLTNSLGNYTATIRVHGGGVVGQAGAIRHAIARALAKADEAMKPTLRKAGLLTRDPRVKERKKYGLKRARKAPQYTKR